MWAEQAALQDSKPPMLIHVPSDRAAKLVEARFPNADNASVELELSHSSKNLNLAKSKVSSSRDLTAYG